MKVVSGLILNSQGEVLLAQRPEGKLLAGYWEFPGGKIEAGETPEQALCRELKEELELEIQLVENLGIYPYTYDFGEIELYVFVVRAKNSPHRTEHKSLRWSKAGEIEPDLLAPADREPLQVFLKR